MRMRPQRGNALILSIIVVLVLAIIGVAVINFASREVAGSTAGRKYQALVACADAGRQQILSQFHALGTSPLSITPLNVQLTPTSQVLGGHFDSSSPGTIQVTQVTYLPQTSFGPDRGVVQNIANRIVGTGGGAKPMKVVVHCQQSGFSNTAGQLEVEFGVRFGI